jgi:hypothetical protein
MKSVLPALELGTRALPQPMHTHVAAGADIDAESPPALDAAAVLHLTGLDPMGSEFDKAMTAMLAAIEAHLPAKAPPLPDPTVSVAAVTERPVGIGSMRGEETRGGLGVVALKGLRLDATVHVRLFADTGSGVDTAVSAFISDLLGSRPALAALGFLRLTLQSVSPFEPMTTPNTFRAGADFQVLFEHRFEESDGTGLIARIPIRINSEYNETTVVTDEMTRWDDVDAPQLVVRGPRRIGRLTGLLFTAGAAPSGGVTLVRSFDGAAGTPASHPDIQSFLAAVAGPDATERHAEVSFASFTDFMAIFTETGDPVPLGDDSYEPGKVDFVPDISLPTALDRFEVRYGATAFDAAAVLYLRASAPE